jgi:ABC-type transport system involved in cytochrome bd biosynthesis fused ATPase/permease subunit
LLLQKSFFISNQLSRKNRIGLETLYDVLTSVEKIGLITDMKLEEFTLDYDNCYTSIALEVENVSFTFPDSKNKILNNINLNIDHERIFIDGANGSERQP